jgi:hypothetical protein
LFLLGSRRSGVCAATGTPSTIVAARLEST